MPAKTNVVTIIIVKRTMSADLWDCGLLVRGVFPQKRRVIIDAVKEFEGFQDIHIVTAGDRDVGAGEKVGDIMIGINDFGLSPSGSEDHGAAMVAGTIRGALKGVRIRKREVDPDRDRSMASIIWGEDWEDLVALTEEEREVLA